MADAIDNIASKMADEAMKAMDETGDDRLFIRIGEVLAAASQTLEEAFLTHVRIRLAARKGQAFMEAAVAKHRASQT